jgi:hypothetical protein
MGVAGKAAVALTGGSGAAAARRTRRAELHAGAAGVVWLLGCGSAAAPAGALGAGESARPGQAPGQLPAGETEFSEAAARRGIQDVLDRQAAARAQGDRAAFMATIDQRNLTWRRIVGDVFAAEAGSRRSSLAYAVTQVAPKQDGYVKAWIDVSPRGAATVVAQGVWVFRQAEQGWLHSEILNEEIGARQTLESPHFVLQYYAWDEDVIERMAAVAEQAHAHVAARTGITPEGRPSISVNPTFAAHSALRGFGTWALYMPGANAILIRSIESFGAGMTPPGETQEARLLVALTHEYAHLVTNTVVSTVKLPKWMVEGFAEYVAGNLRPASMAAALRAGRVMTLDRASDIIEWGTDPARGYSAADIDLAYAHAAHATTYFMERFDQARFFELATTYAESRRWEESFSAVAGVAWPDFERDWLAWTRRRFGA